MAQAAVSRQSLRLKGRSFLALVLSPEAPLPGWFRELDTLIQGSPGFFVARPIILDAAGIKIDADGLREIVEAMRARDINVMGIEGVKPSMLGPGMPPLVAGGKTSDAIDMSDAAEAAKARRPKPVVVASQDEALASVASVAVQAVAAAIAPPASPATPAAPAPAAPKEPEVLLIDTPIRSGQSIIFPGDVTVVGSVASGAEIVAGGSVHVYGALRGRAIAGWNGNGKARIFCRKMEAELIAIDGLYQTAEDMAPAMRGRPVQAWLEGESLKLAELI